MIARTRQTRGMGRKNRAPKASSRQASSLGNAHFRADGAPKTKYSSEREAASAAHMRWVEDKVELNVYPCEFCGGWHMGRPSRSG